MDFRYLVETKNEFNNFLCDILVPHIYNGIKGILKYSENVYEQIESKKKRGSRIENPGIIHIFKKTLEGISSINNHEIEEEYNKIKTSSGFSEWFDNLVRASIKSYVLMLTWDPKTTTSKYSDNKLYEDISIKDFIHKCYITSCNHFRDHPELFLNNRSNKKDIFEIIKKCIETSIKKSLPYNSILEEYLSIEFNKTNDKNTEEIQNIKEMVQNMIKYNKYGQKPVITKILNDSDNSDINKIDHTRYADNYKKIELQHFLENEINNNNMNNINTMNTMNNTNNTNNTNTMNESEIGDTSIVLTRSQVKSKEINKVIEEASKNTNNSETSEDDETSVTSDIVDENILNSPPIIRNKPTERLVNDIELNNDNFFNKKKRNVEIVLNKNNNVSEKFEKIETFFDNMIK